MQYLSTNDAKLLYQAFLSLENDEEVKNFLRDLLTEIEIKDIISRWKIARMLNDKVPYEEITKITGRSSTTVARVSKWLNKGMGGYKLVLKRMKGKIDLS